MCHMLCQLSHLQYLIELLLQLWGRYHYPHFADAETEAQLYLTLFGITRAVLVLGENDFWMKVNRSMAAAIWSTYYFLHKITYPYIKLPLEHIAFVLRQKSMGYSVTLCQALWWCDKTQGKLWFCLRKPGVQLERHSPAVPFTDAVSTQIGICTNPEDLVLQMWCCRSIMELRGTRQKRPEVQRFWGGKQYSIPRQQGMD